ELLWKHPARDGVVSTAAIVGDHVYCGMLSGDLVCLGRTTGELVWSYRSIPNPDPEVFAPGLKAAPTVTADTVFIGDEDGVFHAVDRATGKLRWSFTTGAEIISGAVVDGERV